MVAIVVDDEGQLSVDLEATARLRADVSTDASHIPTTITSDAPIIEKHVPRGRWQTLERDWWETGVINCQLCGQVIPRDVWNAEDGGTFCSTSCDGLFHGYFSSRDVKIPVQDE